MQRRPRDDAEAVVERGGQHLELDGAVDQVVDRLLADQAEEVAPRCGLLGLGDVPAGEVRRADVEDLALLAQDLHRLPDLVPRRGPVDVVHLVEVDVVGLQPPQRRVAGPADVQRGELRVVGPVAHVAVELGREDRTLAPSAALGEPAPDDLLGDALALLPAVDVRGVEEVDAVLVRAVHDRVASPPRWSPGRSSSCRGRAGRPTGRYGRGACSPCVHPSPRRLFRQLTSTFWHRVAVTGTASQSAATAAPRSTRDGCRVRAERCRRGELGGSHPRRTRPARRPARPSRPRPALHRRRFSHHDAHHGTGLPPVGQPAGHRLDRARGLHPCRASPPCTQPRRARASSCSAMAAATERGTWR